MAKERKRGLISPWLLKAGEALQFGAKSSASSSGDSEKAPSRWERLLPYKKKVKTAFAKTAEQSFCLSWMRLLIRHFFATRVRSFAVLFFACGFLQVLSFFLGPQWGILSGGEAQLVMGAVLFFLTLVCSFSKGTVAYALKRSFLFRAVLGPVFGLEEWRIPESSSPRENILAMLLWGIALAFAAVVLSPLAVVLFALILVISLLLFFKPEAGLLFAVALLPVLPRIAFFALMLLTLFSFLFKCAVGKRSLVFSFTDPPMLLGLIPLLFSPSCGGVEAFSFVLLYFLASRLLRSVREIRCFQLVQVVVAFLCAGSMIVRQAIELWSPQLFQLFPRMKHLLFFQPELENGAVLALICPFFFGLFRLSRGFAKATSVLSMGVLVAAFFAVDRSEIWVAVLAGVIAWFVMSHRSALTVFCIFGLGVFSVLQILPNEISRKVLGVFGFGSAHSEEIGFLSSLWQQTGTVGILLFLLIFVAILLDAFRLSRSGICAAVSPAVVSAISSATVFLALILQGVTPDFRCLHLLFACAAIPVAANRACRREEVRPLY